MPLGQAAALTLSVKLPEVMHYEGAARAGKVSGVHDMRVAAKRMREAVRMLRPAFSREARRKLLPTVEELNDALGEVRDRDVLRQAFKRMQQHDPRLADLQAVRRRLAKERRSHHARLLSVLDGLEQSGFARKYARLMTELERQEPTPGGAVVAQFAAEAIGSRLQDVTDNLHAITGRYQSERFHRQRIRVKRLKYALEPFLPLLPPEADELYALVSDLQELMGLIHDVDVQREVLTVWVAAHGLSEGLRRALQQLARERAGLLTQTRGHLQQMLAQDCEGRLQRALQDLADASPAPQVAG